MRPGRRSAIAVIAAVTLLMSGCAAPQPAPRPRLTVSAQALAAGPLHTVLPRLAARAIRRGATLVVPQGTWSTTETVVLPARTRIHLAAGSRITGDLPGKPLIRLSADSSLTGGAVANTSADPGFDVDLAQNARSVTIRGVGFGGPSVNALYLAATGIRDVVIEENRFERVGYGVLLNPPALDARRLTIRANTFIDACADPIEINAATDGTAARVRQVTITGNRISGTCGDGPSSGLAIGLAGVDGFRVADNIVRGARNEAVHLEDGTTNGVVRGNRISGGGHGDRPAIALYRTTSRIRVVDNVVAGFSGGGIAVRWDGLGSASAIAIARNRVSDIDGDGIVVSGGGGTGPFTVQSNVLARIRGTGIAVVGPHELTTVRGNRLSAITGAPIDQTLRDDGVTVIQDNTTR